MLWFLPACPRCTTTPPSVSHAALQLYDQDVHRCLSCTAVDTSDAAWKRSILGLNNGRFGLHSLHHHAPAAHIALFTHLGLVPRDCQQMCLQCVVKENTFFFFCLIWCGLSCCSPAVFCALCIDLPMDVLVLLTISKLWASCCGFNFLGIRIQQMIHVLYMYSWPSTICYSIVFQSVLRQLTSM